MNAKLNLRRIYLEVGEAVESRTEIPHYPEEVAVDDGRSRGDSQHPDAHETNGRQRKIVRTMLAALGF